MKLTDEMLTEISYVQISKYRTRVMKALDDDVKYRVSLQRIQILGQIIFQRFWLN